MEYTITPIGHVQVSDNAYAICINPPHRKGLKRLDEFSHFLVFWWAHQMDTRENRNILQTPLPYADDLTTGVFACRSEFRPNQIGLIICQCLKLDIEKGEIIVPYMDAFDQTPVLDIKPYFPVCERVRETTTPEWVKDWPQWYEEAYKLMALFPEADS